MNGTKRIPDRRLLVGALSACAALAVLAGGASAQHVKTDVKSSVQINVQREGETCSLFVEDGEMWAEVNGERVPDERLRKRDDKVELLGEDGEVLTTFSYSDKPGRASVSVAPFAMQRGAVGWAPLGGFRAVDDQASAWVAGQAEQPKVMVGVTMVDVPEHLRRHLGLGENEAVMLGRVIEGLPADEAGLEDGDVIVAIAGEKPATAEKLRETLKTKEPGEALELTVVQDGEEKTVRLKLREYNAEELSVEAPMAPMALDQAEELQRMLKERMRTLEEERRQLGEQQSKLDRQGKRQGRAAEEAERRNKQLAEQMYRLGEQLKGLEQHMPEFGDDPMVFQIPQGYLRGFAAPGEQAGVEKRVKELDERLADLDERLSALDEKLSRIEKSLDRLGKEKDGR